MKLKPEEITKKADQAVEMFMDVTPLDISLNDSVESVNKKLIQDRKVATQCAILMYGDRVNILKQAKTETEQLLFEISKRYSFTFETTDGSLLEESEVILNNLKERK